MNPDHKEEEEGVFVLFIIFNMVIGIDFWDFNLGFLIVDEGGKSVYDEKGMEKMSLFFSFFFLTVLYNIDLTIF